MMTPDEILGQLLQTFQKEAAGHLQTLNTSLLALELRPEEKRRQEMIQEAFRAAHSLKGAAYAVSLAAIGQLAEAMERVLQAARDAGVHLEASAYDSLYDSLDTIDLLLQGQTVEVEPLISRLSANVISEPTVPPAVLSLAVEAMPIATGNAALPEKSLTPELPGAPNLTADEAKSIAPSVTDEETIRITIAKLNNLMAEVDELLVSRMNAEQRTAEMQQLYNQFNVWPKVWHEMKNLLPQLDDDVGKQLTEQLSSYHERNQIASQEFNRLSQHLHQDSQRLGIIASQLQDNVRHLHMVPFEALVPGLRRAVEDVAHSEGKQVAFHVMGSEVELDKKVLEALNDSLIHLLRNAVSHGIEQPGVRKNRGKPVEGCVQLTIVQRGAEVRISVADDGSGFDLHGLRQVSSKQNGSSLESASQNDIIELAFQPGVTTSHQATPLSGRGIGLDEVRQKLEALQGYIQVDSMAEKGATVHLVVPITLTISRGLLVQVGNERYVLPLLSVLKIIQPQKMFVVEGQTMLMMDGTALPLVSLATLLKRPTSTDEGKSSLAVVIAVAEQRLALLVDDVLTEQELAVKPLGKPLHRVPNVAGVALLGDGKPVVILNAGDLLRASKASYKPIILQKYEAAKEKNLAHILVVDDSITTRTLEKHILETAGYDVTTAMDGQEALQRLKDKPVDLIVSDIEMPNMDGLTLTARLRGDDEYRDLPIILVTSLESSESRERGMVAGANAYIVKRGFDQDELLKTVRQLVFIEES